MGTMNNEATAAGERFLELLRPLQQELEAYARRLLWEPQQVADALQNAALRAYAAFDRYRKDASFRSWMFKILTREAFALNRKHARIARHEFQLDPAEIAELPVMASGPEAGLACGGTLSDILEPELQRALRTLTDPERAVLLLRSIGEMRYREISEALDLPMGSVMGYLARARQKMRAALLPPAPARNLPIHPLP
jgi:RNA polymerase sigma-70 factor (ECF subfamily)